MRTLAIKVCGVVGGLLALFSGFLWWQSADLQLQTLTALATISHEPLAKLGILSARENLWAGELAAASGLFLGIGLIL